MASSQLALALSAPWGDLKLSGRKIKELFYTQVAPPEGADSDLPHFQCRCGKIRIQSLKHGYTNLKQHLMFKHPTWVLEHAEEIQATPPNSPKLERPSAAAVAATNARKGKGKAAAATTAATATAAATATTTTTATAAATAKPDAASPAVPATATGRKKRKMSTGAADQDAAAEPPAKAPPVTRRSRASSAASLASSPPSPPPAAVPSAVVPSAKATAAAASTQTIHKRDDYISWDDYFMSVAFLSAMRSKDPSTQVGACIVNSEKKIVGIGYNGFPNGCSDDTLPWARESAAGDPLETKYPFVCHAEMNAILNKNASDLKGCTIYVALFPCNECAKLIIQSGITHIVYLSDKYHDDWKMVASRRMLDMARVEYRQHHVSKPSIVIDFSAIA